MSKMNYRVLTLAVTLASCLGALAQVTRQESTNQLKKVVYSGDASNCQQLVKHFDHVNAPGAWEEYYWAVVPVPEITLLNMPNLTLIWYGLESYYSPAGWNDCSDWSMCADGVLYLNWKYLNYDPQRNPPLTTSTISTQFKIIVIYEASASLRAENLGTGKSLKLDWKMDAATNQLVRGYKVFRQEKQ